MLSYDRSQTIMQNIARDNRCDSFECVSLEESVGRVLAEDLVARENNPAFDNSAMDGFAINYDSWFRLKERGQCELKVFAMLGAGETLDVVESGDVALEIMTGAALPHDYFDTVIKVEDVERLPEDGGRGRILVRNCPKRGDNVRRAGQDCRVGENLLPKGTCIQVHHLLALATQGSFQIPVLPRFKVGVISTGRELVDFRTSLLGKNQIRNSTGIYVKAKLARDLFSVKDFGIVADSEIEFSEKLKEAFEQGIEFVVSTGAVSMGAYDFVNDALAGMGAHIHFHKCAIRPGKPILFATLDYGGKTRFIFGLPGNPISTAVGLQFFIRPFVYEMLGLRVPNLSKAVLISDVKKPEGLKCFFLGNLKTEGGRLFVEPLKDQESFRVGSFLKANSWVLLPEEGSKIDQGTEVEVLQL